MHCSKWVGSIGGVCSLRLKNDCLEMNLPNKPTVDLLAVDQEPTDEQLAEVMADVARAAREKQAIGEARMRTMMEADLLAAQATMNRLCAQLNFPRR